MTATDPSAPSKPRRPDHDDDDDAFTEDAEEAAESAEHGQAVLARVTDRGLHIAEDVIYALTGLLLVAGALVMLVQGVYKFSTTVSDGVLKAIEATVGSLLIVFILVELLSAVRTIITERKLIAEPFLIVGMLAAIKEMVTVATFRIDDKKTADAMITIGVLAAVVIGLSIAVLLLRRSRTQQQETQKEDLPPE